MKYKALPVVISLLFIVAVIIIAGYFPSLKINYSGIFNINHPRRYYDYDDSIQISYYTIPTIPYIFFLTLYGTLQLLIIRNIKVVYGGFKRVRVVVYFAIVTGCFICILVPPVFYKLYSFFVAGLNPFLSEILYLPLLFHVWFWFDLIVKLSFSKKQIEQ